MTDKEIERNVRDFKGNIKLLHAAGWLDIESEIYHTVAKFNAATVLHLDDLAEMYLRELHFLSNFDYCNRENFLSSDHFNEDEYCEN